MSTHKEGFIPLRPKTAGKPGLDQAYRLQANSVDPATVQSAPNAQAAKPGIGDTGSGPAEPGGPWGQPPEADTNGDDLAQIRRDSDYLADVVAGVPRAIGEDGRRDLAMAREIHAALEPQDIFGRWQVEDLFH